jgi:flagellum-specific peptidoglycan hydrolase FlgJ
VNLAQFQWLQSTVAAAKGAGHIFPEMAGCEAALESSYGTSTLAREANNLFGMKQHAHPIFGTFHLPTNEFLSGQWKTVDAEWVKYPTVTECFMDRMNTLDRLKKNYPHYMAALVAMNPIAYIYEVSKSWSTDPDRAMKVQSIYNLYLAVLAKIPTGGTAEEVRSAAAAEN